MMATWYKHFIPDWMDGTGSLDAEAYRTYHVIVQLIYQNEEPIANNEKAIAGLCAQSLKTYRAALARLVKAGKLTLDEGRIGNDRAFSELKNLDVQRIKAARGGSNSAGKAKTRRKPLETKDEVTPLLSDTNSNKTRLDETRQEETRKSPSRASRLPDEWKPQVDDIAEAKRVLGNNAGREFQKFQDYWKAQPGQRGVKLDWDATWRNWVRKATENGQRKTQRGGSLLDAIDRAREKLQQEEIDLGQGGDPILRLPGGPIRE